MGWYMDGWIGEWVGEWICTEFVEGVGWCMAVDGFVAARGYTRRAGW